MSLYFTSWMVAVIAICSACREVSSNNRSAKQQQSSDPSVSRGPAVGSGTPPEAEESAADAPSQVSGAFLTAGCGAYDTLDADTTTSGEAIGCGVYLKTSEQKHAGNIVLSEMRFQASDDSIEVVGEADFSRASDSSRYHSFVNLPAQFFAKVQHIDGTAKVDGKTIYFDSVQIFRSNSTSTSNITSTSSSTSTSTNPTFDSGSSCNDTLKQLTAETVLMQADPANNIAPEYLTDASLDTSWSSLAPSAKISLSWPELAEVCYIHLHLDSRFVPPTGGNQAENFTKLDFNINVGSGFDASQNLTDARLFKVATQAPVRDDQQLVILPSNTQMPANAATIQLDNCAPSWCGLYEVTIYGVLH